MARKRREREAAATTLQVKVSAVVRGVQARRRCENYRASIVALQVEARGRDAILSLFSPKTKVDAESKPVGPFGFIFCFA